MLIRDFYFNILIYSFICFIVVFALYLLSYLLGVKNLDAQKLSTYECGFEPINSSHTKFNIKFYLVALLFIIFDLEIILLFPWVLNLNNLGLLGYYTMSGFLLILIIGFIYEYKKGALEW